MGAYTPPHENHINLSNFAQLEVSVDSELIGRSSPQAPLLPCLCTKASPMAAGTT